MKLPETIIHSTFISRTLLSAKEDERSVYLIKLSLPDTQYRFEPGDIVFVYPENKTEFVTRALSIIQVQPNVKIEDTDGQSYSIEEALSKHYELRLKSSILEQFPEEKRDGKGGEGRRKPNVRQRRAAVKCRTGDERAKRRRHRLGKRPEQ